MMEPPGGTGGEGKGSNSVANLADMARRLNLRNHPRATEETGTHRNLPPLILMTDVHRLADPAIAVSVLPEGSAVILRHTDRRELADLARRLRPLCSARRVRLLIAGEPRLAMTLGADGIHLSETLLRSGRGNWRRWRHNRLVTAAAHSPTALALAWRAGVDAVLLSPVFGTASHPDVAPLGVLRFAAWCRTSPLPVYALGGVTARTARRLTASGAVGIAGIEGMVPSPT